MTKAWWTALLTKLHDLLHLFGFAGKTSVVRNTKTGHFAKKSAAKTDPDHTVTEEVRK